MGTVLTIALALAVVFAGLGAWIADQKGRSGGEGFALGLLFGPLGVLVEALLPTVAMGVRRQAPAGPRGAAPGPVRPRRSLGPADVEITGPDDPPGWQRYRREPSGEVFWSPAPNPVPEPEAPPTPKRWERPLRRVDLDQSE
jgi:hypothetical protein